MCARTATIERSRDKAKNVTASRTHSKAAAWAPCWKLKQKKIWFSFDLEPCDCAKMKMRDQPSLRAKSRAGWWWVGSEWIFPRHMQNIATTWFHTLPQSLIWYGFFLSSHFLKSGWIKWSWERMSSSTVTTVSGKTVYVLLCLSSPNCRPSKFTLQ